MRIGDRLVRTGVILALAVGTLIAGVTTASVKRASVVLEASDVSLLAVDASQRLLSLTFTVGSTGGPTETTIRSEGAGFQFVSGLPGPVRLSGAASTRVRMSVSPQCSEAPVARTRTRLVIEGRATRPLASGASVHVDLGRAAEPLVQALDLCGPSVALPGQGLLRIGQVSPRSKGVDIDVSVTGFDLIRGVLLDGVVGPGLMVTPRRPLPTLLVTQPFTSVSLSVAIADCDAVLQPSAEVATPGFPWGQLRARLTTESGPVQVLLSQDERGAYDRLMKDLILDECGR